MSASIADTIIAEVAARARITAAEVRSDAHLVTEVGLSSLDVLAVLAFVEERYRVLFPDEELVHLSTVEKIELAILERMTTQPPAKMPTSGEPG